MEIGHVCIMNCRSGCSKSCSAEIPWMASLVRGQHPWFRHQQGTGLDRLCWVGTSKRHRWVLLL